MQKYARFLCGVLSVVAIAIRLLLIAMRPSDLQLDQDGYIAHAGPVSEGRGFLGPWTGRPTAFRPPAYPIMLGLLMRAGFSAAVAVAVTGLLSSLVIIRLTPALCSICLGDGRHGEVAVAGGGKLPVSAVAAAAGFAALWFVAFDPLLVRYTLLPMTEIPCAALLLAALVLHLKSGAAVGSSRLRLAVMSGFLFGIGFLTRPVVGVAFGLLMLADLLSAFRERSLQNRKLAGKNLLRIAVACLGVVMVVGPWIVRNAIRFQRFIPATTHGGYTLALGNNSAFYRDVIRGSDEFPWDESALDRWQKAMQVSSAADGIPLDRECEVDQWYYRQAVAAIRADIPAFWSATALRIQRFWAITSATEEMPWPVRTVVGIWYTLLWAGLGLGVLFDIFRFGPAGQPARESAAAVLKLWLVVFSFLLIHAVYWTDTRMRAPVMPILIVLSCVGWSRCDVRRCFTRSVSDACSHAARNSGT